MLRKLRFALKDVVTGDDERFGDAFMTVRCVSRFTVHVTVQSFMKSLFWKLLMTLLKIHALKD